MKLAFRRLLVVLLSGGVLALGLGAAMAWFGGGTASAAALPRAAATTLSASSPMSAVVSVSPQPSIVYVGDQFTVTVGITTSQPSRAAQTGLSFAPAIVRCDEVTEGGSGCRGDERAVSCAMAEESDEAGCGARQQARASQ